MVEESPKEGFSRIKSSIKLKILSLGSIIIINANIIIKIIIIGV